MAEKIVVVLNKTKEYKRSMRYDAPTEPVIEGAPTNLYVKNEYLAAMGNPAKIRMTLEAEAS